MSGRGAWRQQREYGRAGLLHALMTHPLPTVQVACLHVRYGVMHVRVCRQQAAPWTDCLTRPPVPRLPTGDRWRRAQLARQVIRPGQQ